MLKFNFLPILKARWIKYPYAFLVKNGFSPNLAAKMSNEKIAAIRIDHIEKLCLVLNCTPNDLFRFTPDKNHVLPENHALNQLTKNEEAIEWLASINKLPLGEIKKLADDMKRNKEEAD